MLCLMLIVEVCQGPDCTGLGGGAALLEIEELIQETQYQQKQIITTIGGEGERSDRNGISRDEGATPHTVSKPTNVSLCVKEGGCRDLCTVGPNARLLHKKHGSIESFHHINDASKCNLVIQKALLLAANISGSGSNCSITEPSTSSGVKIRSNQSHQSMMARRAERMRWEALRNISRKLAKCKKDITNKNDDKNNHNLDVSYTVSARNLEKVDHNRGTLSSSHQKINSCKRSILEEDLVSSSKAELSAAKGSQLENDRVIRRQERLCSNVIKRLETCFQSGPDNGNDYSSSDDDNEDDSICADA